MKKLPMPKQTAKSTFQECISKVRVVELQKRLSACTGLIIVSETEFGSKITKGDIHTILSESVINGNVSAAELEKVYTYRMAQKGSPGRAIYDKLISVPELGICPLCNHRDVETLDHYLPKADFPRLTVTPSNLIPACFPCNKGKSTKAPTKAEEETLHPYYDDIESDEWIFAKVNRSNPVTLSFYAAPPAAWDKLLQNRAIHHFDSFHLNKLYSVQAAVLLRNIKVRLISIYAVKKEGGVKKYLKGEWSSRNAVDKNSWQTVFYRTLYKDEWFCNGGFKERH